MWDLQGFHHEGHEENNAERKNIGVRSQESESRRKKQKDYNLPATGSYLLASKI
jgi:hypothetical protein